MPPYFLDSSALVKRYHQESGSIRLASLFNTKGNQIVVSRLALLEVQSAFARLVREAAISENDLAAIVMRIEAEVADLTLAVAAVSGPRLDAAAAILRTHGVSHAVRTLDAIHLATARALHSRSPLAAFVAADRQLLTSAAALGLATLDASK
jgi:predicted nucleic acid-binding protein